MSAICDAVSESWTLQSGVRHWNIQVEQSNDIDLDEIALKYVTSCHCFVGGHEMY